MVCRHSQVLSDTTVCRLAVSLIRGHAITQSELKMLKNLAMLSQVAHPGHSFSS
jgi:hypothetical protein